MLAEPGIGDCQGIPRARTAEQGDRKAEADGRGGGILVDDYHLAALKGAGPGRWNAGGGAGGKPGQIGAELGDRGGVVAATDPQYDAVAGEMLAVEAADVLHGDASHAGQRSLGNVTVRGAGKDRVIEHGLSQLFVAGVAKRVLEVVERIAPEPLEVFLPEGRLEDRVEQQGIVGLEVVFMDSAAEDGHLDVDAG